MISLTPKPSQKYLRNRPPSSRDYNHLDNAISDTSENKTNATSDANIGSLKSAIKEEWNKMSAEFILRACKLFRRRVDTIIETNDVHIE